MDFPQLTMTLPDGREESIMKRTTLVRCHLPAPLASAEAAQPQPCPALRPPGLCLACARTHLPAQPPALLIAPSPG